MANIPYPSGPVYSIDVECVATGTDHNSRAVAQISLVDQTEKVICNLYVKPGKPVVSYLTKLTGLTADKLEQHGVPLAQAVATLRQNLPRTAVLVGQNIGQDVSWLQLKEGTDFASMMDTELAHFSQPTFKDTDYYIHEYCHHHATRADLAGIYRAWNTQYRSWSVYGQDHVAKVLLGWDTETQNENVAEHDAVTDAIKSIRLFNHYFHLQRQPGAWEAAQQALLSAPPAMSFARRFPVYDGVCMGNRKSCTCGAPFFS